MAKLLSSLYTGSKIKDNNGNIFRVASHDAYGENVTTLFHYKGENGKYLPMHDDIDMKRHYGESYVHEYLSGDYLEELCPQLVDIILDTTIQYTDYVGASANAGKLKKLTTKAFCPSISEVPSYSTFDKWDGEGLTRIPLLNYSEFSLGFWTRSESDNGGNFAYRGGSNLAYDGPATNYILVAPLFNLSSSALVSDDVVDGCYTFIFNEPPVIQNINNINGNYGTPTNITYTVTDNDDKELTHYISIDSGDTYIEIKPTVNNNKYTYSHIFNELKTYFCRIKVVDSVGNTAISNSFIVDISNVAPTIDIVSVVNKVVTFKVNSITSEVSKVEILINDNIVKTFESGFISNLSYEVDRTIINLGKNSMQIKATSKDDLVAYANLEVIKEKYPLPPAGTKVEVNGFDYFILRAFDNGDYQTYVLTENLKSNVKVNDIIKVSQDSVKVLCSLSNVESIKDYKEMKLVKTKKLKGDLEGYIEEKYELQGEGRYSTIKLDLEKFSSSAELEVLELQQYFDYMED